MGLNPLSSLAIPCPSSRMGCLAGGLLASAYALWQQVVQPTWNHYWRAQLHHDSASPLTLSITFDLKFFFDAFLSWWNLSTPITELSIQFCNFEFRNLKTSNQKLQKKNWIHNLKLCTHVLKFSIRIVKLWIQNIRLLTDRLKLSTYTLKISTWITQLSIQNLKLSAKNSETSYQNP